MAQEKALLIDIKRCIGCLSCETACKQLHGFGTEPEPTLSDTAFTVVEARGDKFVRKICMHCEDPACASACPVGAISKTALGPVVYDAGKCIGCRYCMLACPYQVPRYQWTKLAPFVKKCDLCSDRIKAGKSTACAEACPVRATVFGNRDDLINEAWNRIRGDKSYVPHIWGVKNSAAAACCLSPTFPSRSWDSSLLPAAISRCLRSQPARWRLAQSCHHGWHYSLGAVLGDAAAARSCAG